METHDIFFLISNLGFLASYTLTSMLGLRIVTCFACFVSVCTIYSVGLDKPGMMMLFIFTSINFMINSFQILRLIWLRLPAKIPSEFESIYNRHFNAFTAREFNKLIEYSNETEMTDTVFLKCGEPSDLYLIQTGYADISYNDQKIGTLSAGEIIGEMSFLSAKKSIADVKAKQTVSLRVWSSDNISRMRKKYPKIISKLEHLLLTNIVGKVERLLIEKNHLGKDTVND